MALHRLTALEVQVPDVAAAARFYTDFGLTALDADAASGVASLATADGGEQLRLVAGERRGLRSIGVGVDDPDDLDRMAASVAAHDAALAIERTSESVAVHDPSTGVRIEATIAARIVDPPGAPYNANGPGHRDRRGRPSDAVSRTEPVQPRRLSHVVLGSPDHEATIALLVDGIGFQVSDAIGGIGAFLRCSTSHHNVMIQASPAPLLHHTAWEVEDLDEVGRGGAAILERWPDAHVWGLGRHAIGSNWFWYLRDPAGTFAEYTSDLDEIDGDDYRPLEWEGMQVLRSWAPPVPAEFLAPQP